MAKALEAFQKGHYAHALVLFDKEIQSNPEDPYLYYHFALSCYHTNNHKKTVEVADTILEKFPGFVEADRVYKLLVFSYIQMGEWESADRILVKRLHISPRDITLLSFKGHILEKKGQYDSAVDVYREIISIQPEHKTSLNNLGYLLLIRNTDISSEDLALAIQCLKKAIRLDPQNPAYLDSFGTLLEKTGNKEKAIAALEKAVALAPGQSILLDHLAKLRKP